MDLDKIIHGLQTHLYASDGTAFIDIGPDVVKLPLLVFTVLVLFIVLASAIPSLMIGVYIGHRGYVQRLSAKAESDHVSQDEAVLVSTETVESDTLSDEQEVQVIKIVPPPRRAGFLGQWLAASTPAQPITKATPQAPQARHRSY